MTDILLGDEFVKEYPNFPPNLQNAIVDFIYLVERYGFDHAVFCHYKGKISPSWRNLSPTDPNIPIPTLIIYGIITLAYRPIA